MNRRQMMQTLGIAPVVAATAPAKIALADTPAADPPDPAIFDNPDEEWHDSSHAIASAMSFMYASMTDTRLTFEQRLAAAKELAATGYTTTTDLLIQAGGFLYRVK